MSGGMLLRVEDLKAWFARGDRVYRAVDGVGFTVGANETFALVGESGCGKSVTALSLMRLLPDNGRIVSGVVRLGERDLLTLPEVTMRNVRGREIAMIFQEPMVSLNPVMTVGSQLREAVVQESGNGGWKQAVLALLDAVGMPGGADRLDAYPFQLSGGMKQRVMIAMALAGTPRLLIADEPTTALDVTIQSQVLALLRSVQTRTGMGMLLITHDLAVVAENADRLAVMYAGVIVETGGRDQFFKRPFHPYSRKLFEALPGKGDRQADLAVIRGTVPRLDSPFPGCRFADRCDHAWDRCHDTPPPWVELEQGHGVLCHLAAPGGEGRRGAVAEPAVVSREGYRGVVADQGGEIPLLEVDGLKVHFPIRKGLLQRAVGVVKAVDGISFRLMAGQTLALVGESGCGKTTAAKGILQLLPVTGGSVRFAGDELTRLNRRALRARRAAFQFVFQDPFASLNPRMRVVEIIEEGMHALGVGTTQGERLQRIDAVLAQVGLAPDSGNRYPHEFSGGQRQRIAIARALAVNPQLLVCDEPTSALDVSVQAQILNLLRRLQKEMGLSYLFITHNLAVVDHLAHHVAVMYLGRIVEQGPVDQVMTAPRHPYTQILLAAVPSIEGRAGEAADRLAGEQPSAARPPQGCHFHPRCPQAMPVCRERYPDGIADGHGRLVRCHLYT